MLFGDAATATWMGEDALWQLAKPSSAPTGRAALESQGRGVLHERPSSVQLALLKVPAHLHELIDESDLKAEDIDAFCIHQGSGKLLTRWRVVLKASLRSSSKTWSRIRNTVSSSIPLLLEKHALDTTWKRVCTPSGFGVGLSWGSAIIHRPCFLRNPQTPVA